MNIITLTLCVISVILALGQFWFGMVVCLISALFVQTIAEVIDRMEDE